MGLATILAAALIAAQKPSGPQVASATLNVILGSHARLSFSATSLSFPDADPDASPKVASVPGTLDITAKARTSRNGQITVTVQSTDDLRSGVTTLPASLISWHAQGAGFMSGSLSAATAQLVGAWTGSGVRAGSQSYFFKNDWTHPPGTYSLTLVYTISSP